MKKSITIFLLLLSLTSFGQALIVGSIASSQFVCTSCLPARLTSTPPNGTSPVYQWQSSLNNSTFTNINGATADTYQSDYLTTTTYFRQQQNATGVTGGPLPTNTVTLTVTNTQLVRLLQNDTVTGTECYNAIDTLTTASADERSPWIVKSGGHVSIFAGQHIIFMPGTKIDSGSYLYAYTRTLIKAVNKVVQQSRRKVNGVEVKRILKVNGVKNY